MKMVMMKIDVDASMIQAAAVVDCEFPLQIPSRGEVSWYCGCFVSLISDMIARGESV
jgi:hypothetical protein